MKTLNTIAAAVQKLTEDGHLPVPDTVVVGLGSALIMPELPGAPVSGLLVWAMHLDGYVTYDAEILFKDQPEATTAVRAHGKLDGIDITLAANTRRPMRKLMDHPNLTRLAVTEMELRELAADEEVLGQLA